MKTTGSKIYKVISLILLVTVMVIIFVLSHQNGSESSQTSGFITNIFTVIFGNNFNEALIRTFGHFSEFAVLGFLTFNCIYSFCGKKKFFISAALSWLYAWSDEIHQIFIPQRAFQLIDLAVDLCGIILGVAIIFILITAVEKISQKNRCNNHK